MQTILEQFQEDHRKIVNLIESSYGRIVNRQELLHSLEWQLKRHLYLEEKAMFLLVEGKNSCIDVLLNFLNQHNSVLHFLEMVVFTSIVIIPSPEAQPSISTIRPEVISLVTPVFEVSPVSASTSNS